MQITAVIPTWNGHARLGKILPQARAQGFARIVVVDDGSQDGSGESARRLGADVVCHDRNEGFCRAVNDGIRAAGSEGVAILNDDVELGEGWLRELSRALEADGDAWFATGRILSATDRSTIDGTFDLVARSGCAWRAGSGRQDGPVWRERRRVRSAPLTAALFRRELFERVGLLDERLGTYLEDVDFGLRCASSGHTGLYVPEAVAWHEGSATLGQWSAEAVRNIARNQVALVAKHFGRAQLLRYGWQIAIGQLLWGGVAFRHGALGPWLQGKFEGIRQFSRLRGEPLPGLDEILREGEQEIRRLQAATGQDRYWRAYFRLCL